MISARALLRDAIDRLRGAGIDSARVDAELLLAHCLGIERSQLSTVDDVADSVRDRFADVVTRRAAREPLQHIVGRAAFRYLDVAVGPGAFIPRPETELLVDAVLAAIAPLPAAVVVDLCAGTGAIALSVASEAPTTTVYAVERAPQAVEWLRRNCGEAVTVVEGDVRDATLLADLRGRVDVVVSNPPYVPETTAVAAEVRADPSEAVFAGMDGLAVIPSIVSRAEELLRPGGTLVVEHDDTHGEAVPALLCARGCWSDVADHRDLAGRPRYATAVLSRPGQETSHAR